MDFGKQKASRPGDALDRDEGETSRLANPPRCPRCDLTKQQYKKFVENYQRVYRRKMDALRGQLDATKKEGEGLRGEIKRLGRGRKVHVFSIVLGVGLGLLCREGVVRLRAWLKERRAAAAREGDGSNDSANSEVLVADPTQLVEASPR